MKRVIIESPYAGEIKANTDYALCCLRDSLARGEAPFASHLFYPQLLVETIPEERRKGIYCGYAWMEAADLVAIYTNRGMSRGMTAALRKAIKLGKPIVFRSLKEN